MKRNKSCTFFSIFKRHGFLKAKWDIVLITLLYWIVQAFEKKRLRQVIFCLCGIVVQSNKLCFNNCTCNCTLMNCFFFLFFTEDYTNEQLSKENKKGKEQYIVAFEFLKFVPCV